MGGTIVYHYLLYKDWIAYLQEEEDISSYDKFEWLVFSLDRKLVEKDKWSIYEKMLHQD